MTKPEQPKPIPIPALLVYGKPTSPDLPLPSWFRAEDRQAVTSAAQTLKFSMIDIQSDAERALIVGVHESVLKGSGRMIVASVSVDVYRRIEEHVRKASRAPTPSVGDAEIGASKLAPEQTTNILSECAATPSTAKAPTTAPEGKSDAVAAASPRSDKPEPTPPRDPWDALRIGSYVLGKYWEDDGEPIGWWVGVISEIDGKDFIIR